MLNILRYGEFNFGNLLLLYKTNFVNDETIEKYLIDNNMENNIDLPSFLNTMSMFESFSFESIVNSTLNKILYSLVKQKDLISDIDFYDYLCDINARIGKLDFVANCSFEKMLNKFLFVNDINIYLDKNIIKEKYETINIDNLINNYFGLIIFGKYKNFFFEINYNQNYKINIWNEYFLIKNKFEYTFDDKEKLNNFIKNKIFTNKLFVFDYMINLKSYVFDYSKNFDDFLNTENLK